VEYNTQSLSFGPLCSGYNDAVSSRLVIVNPCPKAWANLAGDGRERYCETCRRSVHAIQQYSREEWDQLWRDSGGRVCGVLEASPPEPRSRRAVLVGALLTAISPLMAQSGRVRIRVTDATGAVIPVAQACLLGRDDKPIRTAHANEVGEILFADLPLGDCRITVDAPQFIRQIVTTTLQGGDEAKLEVALRVGAVGEIVTIKAHRRWWWLFLR